MINVSGIFAGFSASTATQHSNIQSEKRPDPIELKEDDLRSLKEEIAGYDLENISQQELVALGGTLFHEGLINDTVYAVMGLGNAEYDERGNQINEHKKFNALEYFDKQLSLSSEPGAGGELGSASGKDGYKQLNQVLSVLKFFATSNTPDLALKTKA